MRGIGEVVDEEPRDVPRHPDARCRRSSQRRATRRAEAPGRAVWVKKSTMSYATCRGTRPCGVGEVVDDEPARGEVVDDEPRNKPRHLDAWRC
jgi:hypothetical protein